MLFYHRYNGGHEKIGMHRDNEPEMDITAPMVSFSFGQERSFIFEHVDDDMKMENDLSKIYIELEHGSALIIHPPTNTKWYHGIPREFAKRGVRINLTFRKLLC